MKGKVAEYETKTNFYLKKEAEHSDISYFEVYRKEETKKITYIQKESGVKIINFIYPDNTNIYIDIPNETNIMRKQKDATFNNVEIQNYIDFYNTFKMILNSLIANIRTEKVGETEYYVISNFGSSINYTIENNVKNAKFYFNKNTGLLERVVKKLDTGEEHLTTYEYKFNIVTDEDLQEPDISNYKIES